MKVILLAAGNSSRTFPISNKNFLPFGDIPLFIHLIKNAQKGGLNNFIIVGQEDHIQKYKTILHTFKIHAEFVIQKNLAQGMAGASISALESIDENEEVFLLGGNDLVEPEIYQTIINTSKNADGGILAKQVTRYFPGGYLCIDKHQRITQIIEKPGAGNEPSDLINIVTHYFKSTKKLKAKLHAYQNLNTDFYEKALQELFEENHFKAIKYNGQWNTIKYPWHILDMMQTFLEKQETYCSPTATISEKATLKGPRIHISENVTILENTVIQGPCFIGHNTTIGNNCLIRNAMIGQNSSIGFNTEVARSFLSQNISTHYAYIGDSVVDEDVNFGAFSCTANQRLDKANIKMRIKNEKLDSFRAKLGAFVGKGVQIGIHGQLMPGALIAPGETVLPGGFMK